MRATKPFAIITATVLSASSGGVRATAQAPNVPVFSLWATEVTDGLGGPNRCIQCPTQSIPLGQVAPGDVVRVEIYVSNWDAQPGRGHCNGDPALGQDGQCSNIGTTCPGRHCSTLPGMCCCDITGCGSYGTCVLNTCEAYPKVSEYWATIDGESLVSSGCGELVPYRIPCDPFDCLFLEDGTCPCAHYYQSTDQCTCVYPNGGGCHTTTNLCNIEAALFIEGARPDFLFFGLQTTPIFSFAPLGYMTYYSYLSSPIVDRVADPGTRRYLGTMLLEVSEDASGVFEIAFVKDGNVTYVAGHDFGMVDGAIYQDLVIGISGHCGIIDSDHDGVFDFVDNCTNAANPDQADCDGNGVGDVCDQVCGGQIEWTTFPADGAIDAREDVDAVTGLPVGITQFDVSFGCLVGIGPSGSPPGAVDFEVADTSGEAQVVIAAASSDDCLLEYVVITSEALTAGEWTTIESTVEELHTNEMPAVSETLTADVGFLPGDVDGSGSVDPIDVEALRAALELLAALTPALELSVDIDRSGALTALDLVREVDLLNGANSTRVWNGEALPMKPN